MVTPAVDGIDLFKIAGRSISGWIPSFKMGAVSPLRQPFCSQLEERLLMWLEYHPQVVSYARGDIGPAFASAYRLPLPKDAPFAIGYTFEGKPHHYLPDAVGTLQSGRPFIAEAGMEDDKQGDRNLAKAEAARRLAHIQRGVFWLGTEHTLTRQRHYNLVFLHARRRTFPAKARDRRGFARDLALGRGCQCRRGREPSCPAVARQSGRSNHLEDGGRQSGCRASLNRSGAAHA